MSFILDALRKSERERRQDAAPGIARIPDAVPPRTTPGWAIATIAVLGVGVVALGGAWIHALVTAPAGTAASGRPAALGDGTRVQQVALPPPPAAPPDDAGPRADGRARPDAPAAEPARTAERPSLAALAQTEADAGPGPAGGSPRSLRDAVGTSAARPAASSAASSETSPSRSALPPLDPAPASYASLAPSLGLPKLDLEILAYADEPAQRFVFINGRRYREGDSLPGGARVISINPRGAVLLANGRQLQLDQH